MKLFKTILSLLIVLVASFVWAATQSAGTGLLTESSVVSAVPCAITSVEVITDGTNAATVIVYDHASAASGTVISQYVCPGASNFCGQTWDVPRFCANGIYVAISGTGAKTIVEYLPR